MFALRLILLVIAVSIPFGNSFADEVVKGQACYSHGDSESVLSAKKTVLDLAKRNALESYWVYVNSSSTVKDFELKKDKIQSAAIGYLHNMKILQEKNDGKEFCASIQASVNPNEIKELIGKIEITKEVDDGPRENVCPENDKKIICATGYGLADTDLPKEVWKYSAEDSAVLDAKAKLLTKIQNHLTMGEARENFKSKARQTGEVSGILRNYRQVGKTFFPTDKTAEVTLEADLDENKQ